MMGIGTPRRPYSSGLNANPRASNERPRKRKSTLGGWILEILCCITSAACLLSIVEVLLVYNHKPPPAFPLGVTLNSLAALLSSIASMTCTFVVAEGVSQMKWNHYARGKSRPLSDFQAFDNASRGVWGGFKLLFVVDSVR